MDKILDKFQAWVLTIFLVVLLEPVSWMTSYISPCILNANEYEHRCPTFSTYLVSIKDFIFEKMSDPNWVTAIATATVAGFTIVLAYATHRQAVLTRQAIELGTKEFVATHRPKLIVRQFQIDPVSIGQPITIRFAIVNIGNTDGIPRLIACEIGLWNADHFELPGIDAFQKQVTLPPIKGGQRVALVQPSNFMVTKEQYNYIIADEFIVSILGEITYADSLGTPHRTGFRRILDRKSDKFIASTDKDEEYCD